MRQSLFYVIGLALLLDPLNTAGTVTGFLTIDYPGGSSTNVNGINNLGQIVGTSGTDGVTFGFLSSSGHFTTINGGANGINNAGNIVGCGDMYTFLYVAGKYTSISVPGALETCARSINDNGLIVGWYLGADEADHGFLYSAGTFTSIDVPNAADTTASGINNLGQIVGTYHDKNFNSHGFLFDHGTFTTIDAPGSAKPQPQYTELLGINNRGQIVGNYLASPSLGVGFVDDNGVFTTFAVPNAYETEISGINDSGQVAGIYSVVSGVDHGFLALYSTSSTSSTPNITSLVNAASFLNQAISPGEVVSIFGTAIGPQSALQLRLDSTGKVSTSLGNAQVLFSGHPAPLTYVSTTQVNCVVPYEIVGISNPSVQVNYSGQASNAIVLPSAPTSPGVFATNGTGQAAALNQDGSVNGPTHPEAAGNIVSIFMTGEGQTLPPGVTGSVTCQSGCNTLQQIPVPQQQVTAVVGNQPATVTFYGEAPGLVSGVLQVNLVVPPNTPSGAVPLAISVGGKQSQTGVNLSVR
jgi:uncharacterized protein (TIGR03437 family)